MSQYKPILHPVYRMPTAAEAKALGPEKWIALMKKRDEQILRERDYPLRYGWEPPIWRLCDALLEWPWIDKAWAAQVRSGLGFKERIRMLLILGGNRGSKSEYAAKRLSQLMWYADNMRVWPLHSSGPMSREYQQPLFWKYLPPDCRRNVKGQVEYIAYKQKTGFSDDKFVLSNGSECSFRNYEQDPHDAIEGGDVNALWNDELVPEDWIETELLRIATREGWALTTFTPVRGYSATVRLFLDGAETVLEEPGYLLPRDGGDMDVAHALGFRDPEHMKWEHAGARWSMPGDPVKRILGTAPTPEIPAGRTFETVPRVMRPLDKNFAVVFFHSADNPYGNPKEVVETVRQKPRTFQKERFYGIAEKLATARFPKFNTKVHVIPAKAIPADGIRLHFADPASGRNFFMKWYLITREAVYLTREWPSYYDIPGVGVPGPWALPDGRKADGKPGPAQKSFGFGLLRYKMEIARLEGWQDYRTALTPADREKLTETLKKEQQDPGQFRDSLFSLGVDAWTPKRGAREKIFMRFLDSRAASSPRVENNQPKTLQTDFEDLDLYFELTPGDDVDEGVAEINAALDYDEDKPLDFFNKPHFYVSEECRNSIFALQTWTGEQGGKGACKDPVDLDRYLFLSDCVKMPLQRTRQKHKGGHY